MGASNLFSDDMLILDEMPVLFVDETTDFAAVIAKDTCYLMIRLGYIFKG